MTYKTFFRSTVTAENYVFNPINAFHMLKRNAEWLPKLFPTNSIYNRQFSNPDSIIQEAAFGIVDVQEFYDLHTDDIINGILKDETSGLWHKSEQKLTFQEVLLIADAAKSSHYFDRHVQWLQSAISMAKNHHWFKKLEKDIKKAKSMHDKAYKVSLVSTICAKID